MKTKRVEIEYIDGNKEEIEIKEWTAKQQLDFIKRIKATLVGNQVSINASLDEVIKATIEVSKLNIDLNRLTGRSLMKLSNEISELNSVSIPFREEDKKSG